MQCITIFLVAILIIVTLILVERLERSSKICVDRHKYETLSLYQNTSHQFEEPNIENTKHKTEETQEIVEELEEKSTQLVQENLDTVKISESSITKTEGTEKLEQPFYGGEKHGCSTIMHKEEPYMCAIFEKKNRFCFPEFYA